jgi:hypothetical protein
MKWNWQKTDNQNKFVLKDRLPGDILMRRKYTVSSAPPNKAPPPPPLPPSGFKPAAQPVVTATPAAYQEEYENGEYEGEGEGEEENFDEDQVTLPSFSCFCCCCCCCFFFSILFPFPPSFISSFLYPLPSFSLSPLSFPPPLSLSSLTLFQFLCPVFSGLDCMPVDTRWNFLVGPTVSILGLLVFISAKIEQPIESIAAFEATKMTVKRIPDATNVSELILSWQDRHVRLVVKGRLGGEEVSSEGIDISQLSIEEMDEEALMKEQWETKKEALVHTLNRFLEHRPTQQQLREKKIISGA